MEATMWCFEKIENGRNVEKEKFQNLKLYSELVYIENTLKEKTNIKLVQQKNILKK